MAIRITSNTRPAIFRPTTKDELQSLIEQELERQGWDADLNFIDTSLITDMSWLFHPLYYVRNIKIDEWDVSNVTDMDGMFMGCDMLMTDISTWNTKNVRRMNRMFGCCFDFKCDLSVWDTSNVIYYNNIFNMCNNMSNNPQLQPKFKH
jgi:surface protein